MLRKIQILSLGLMPLACDRELKGLKKWDKFGGIPLVQSHLEKLEWWSNHGSNESYLVHQEVSLWYLTGFQRKALI